MDNKTVLIISPYFPPTNAADMHRVRMSLPYFRKFGWQAEVVTVDPQYCHMVTDPLLNMSVPVNQRIHYVKAFSSKLTSKIGLGSVALRSLWFFKREVDILLRSSKYDLIYFSTTQFPVCVLGAYWKKKFKIPYVIDLQDPWHSDYYLNKPKTERPNKFWFSYRLNKYLEPIAMRKVGGLISVSEKYLKDLTKRYPLLANVPKLTLTFGYSDIDFSIAKSNDSALSLAFKKEPGTLNLLYIGRGGFDMQPCVNLIFTAFKELLEENYDKVEHVRFHFVGTSYAAYGTGVETFLPLARNLNIEKYVNENTNRITFYESIKGLLAADGLLVLGSSDSGYTASKLYPYIVAKKPLLGIFNASSSAYKIIRELSAGIVGDIDNKEVTVRVIKKFILGCIDQTVEVDTDWKRFEAYSAELMTEQQCSLFDKVLSEND